MDLNLKNKVAMIAGASRGLGFAVAKALAAEGVKVSISSRDQAAVAAAANSIREQTETDVFSAAVDVRSADAIHQWFNVTCEKFGGVDLLYPNAGGPPTGPTLQFDDDAWQDAFDQLLLSAIRMVRLAVPSMIVRGGGSIVFPTSSGVKEPIPNLSVSTVIRSSVSALSKTLANELAPKGIRVNQLIPGRIHTDRVEQLDQGNASRLGVDVAVQRQKMVANIPLGRYGRPEEFAAAAVFLFSDAARFITGATLSVDGGQLRGI